MNVTKVWRGDLGTARAAALMLGFSAVTGQVILLRAMMAMLNASEASLGPMFAAWLVWTAAGSVAGGRLAGRMGRARSVVAALGSAMGVGICAGLVALHFCRMEWTATPGELLGPLGVLSAAAMAMSLFCLASGASFAAVVRLASEAAAEDAASTVYLFEAIGSAAGGVLASLALVRLLEPMQMAAMLLVLNTGFAAWLMTRRRAWLSVACGLAAAVVLMGWIAPHVDRAIREREWPGFHVLDARESLYGSLTVLEAGGVRSLFENGTLVATVPDPEAAEEQVHFALLEHPAPRRVLLIGGSASGAAMEALKHPTVERLDLVELDPMVLRVLHERIGRPATEVFHDHRVFVHLDDGRRFLALSRERWDAIVVVAPDPETAALNRFFTVEFFREARSHLNAGGVFSFSVRSAEEAMSPELREFLQSVNGTLGAVVPHVVAIPGDTMHFVSAVEDGVVTDRADVLVARLKERHLATQFVREYFLPFRMAPERMGAARAAIAPVADTRLNRDFAPIAYYENAVLRSAEFRPGMAEWMRAAARIPFWRIAFGVAAAALLMALNAGLPRKRRRRAITLLAMGSTGFTLMALQLLLLLGFQAIQGYLYQQLALLLGMMMAGVALGGWWGKRRPGANPVWVQCVLAAAAPALMGLMTLLRKADGAAAVAFPAMAVAAGFLGGVQFPRLAARMAEGGERGAGLLYSADLVGGCVAALVLAAFLVPVYGLWAAAWLCAVAGAGAAVATTRLP